MFKSVNTKLNVIRSYFKQAANSSAGFTLVELLIVIGLMALTIGVTGDIILTLIRSYSKTEITNDIEQNSNFVSLKTENELRNAISIDAVTPTSLTFTKQDGAGTSQIVYEIQDFSGSDGFNSVARQVDGGSWSLLTDNHAESGVRVECNTFCFRSLGTAPDIVQIRMEFRQASSTGGTSFTGDIILDNTIVVKGTY